MRSSAGRDHIDLQNKNNVKRVVFINSLKRWTVHEKMEEGGWVRVQTWLWETGKS